jgi:hypothetical protein
MALQELQHLNLNLKSPGMWDLCIVIQETTNLNFQRELLEKKCLHNTAVTKYNRKKYNYKLKNQSCCLNNSEIFKRTGGGGESKETLS